MSTRNKSAEPQAGLNLGRLGSGALGGIVGALLFGLLVEFVLTDLTVAMAVPGVYGIEGPLPVAGWGMHLAHGGLLGIVYVIAVQYEPLVEYAHDYPSAAVLGVVYGVALTVLVAVLAAPVLFGVLGDVLELPAVTAEVVAGTLLGHVLFAIVVALTYAAYVTRYNPETAPDEVVS